MAAVVVVAHVAFVLVLVAAREGRHSISGEVLEVTFFPLPITAEDERAATKTPFAEARPGPAAEARSAPARKASLRPSNPSARAGTAQTETPPSPLPEPSSSAIDWQAQLGAAAGAMDERARAERERRSFSAPPPHASLAPRGTKPPCPFERCEPGWGAAPSIFDSTATKKGRIEQTPDGEVIRWISNNCYQILITANEFHRAMTRCFKPLGKNNARGDLFDHMRDVPVPEEEGFDVP